MGNIQKRWGVAAVSVAIALAVLAVLMLSGGQAEAAEPTCSSTLGIANHGHHVVPDYVTGIGHENMDWPPSGGVVGDATSSNGGAAVPGGPGPGFHFPNGFSPGASFCLDQSNSPGVHLGP
jgi:hypothetical protein